MVVGVDQVCKRKQLKRLSRKLQIVFGELEGVGNLAYFTARIVLNFLTSSNRIRILEKLGGCLGKIIKPQYQKPLFSIKEKWKFKLSFHLLI
jgi:hypothetical protein